MLTPCIQGVYYINIRPKYDAMFKGRLICFVCVDVVALVSGCFMRNKKVRWLRS